MREDYKTRRCKNKVLPGGHFVSPHGFLVVVFHQANGGSVSSPRGYFEEAVYGTVVGSCVLGAEKIQHNILKNRLIKNYPFSAKPPP